MTSRARGSTCLILTYDRRILLQERDDMDMIGRFGGGVEDNETHMQGMQRELHEELGAVVDEDELILLGELPGINRNTQIPFIDAVYFWHDQHNKITGCYEGGFAHFTNAAEALANPRLSENTRRTVNMALDKKLIT